jgi:RP/EB family microtubule-associated protein
VDVPKLCRAKPLDNLEFLQWIKRYFDLHFGGHEYNALERRGGKGAVPLKENDSGNKPAPKVAAVKNGAVRVATSSSSSRPASAANKKTAAPSTVPALCCRALLTLRWLLSLLLLLLPIICP